MGAGEYASRTPFRPGDRPAPQDPGSIGPAPRGLRPREGLVQRTPEARRVLARQLADARLRLIAPLLIVTVGALCLRDSVFGGRTLTALELTLAGLAGSATLLLFARGVSDTWMPRLEAVIVWLSGGYLAVRAFDPQSWVQTGAVPIETLRHLDHASVAIGLLIVGYCVAVPNTPRRAAAVTLPLAVAPLLVSLLRLLSTPEIAVPAAVAGVLMTDTIMVPVAATAIGLYAVFLLDRYRDAAERARDEGRYRLVHRIGSGGMGEVWLAHHHMLARPVALKMIRADHLGDPERVRSAWVRFEQEAQAIAALRSPHTVELYDFGITTDEVFYYVMEYLSGLDLERLVERHGPLSPQRVVYLLRQICASLGDAHAHGLIHRDIKPANIVVSRMGTEYDFVKILDFGLVKSLAPGSASAEITLDGAFVGTPAYASPEVASGEGPVGPAADIYSVGCVAYWLLTGTTVFPATGHGAMLADHIKTPPEPLSTRAATWIPPELEAVVMRCLEKVPDDRFRSPADLDAALAECPLPVPWGPRRARDWWEMNEARRREVGLEERPGAGGGIG